MKSVDKLSKQVTIGKEKAILNFLDNPSNLKFEEKEGKTGAGEEIHEKGSWKERCGGGEK